MMPAGLWLFSVKSWKERREELVEGRGSLELELEETEGAGGETEDETKE